MSFFGRLFGGNKQKQQQQSQQQDVWNSGLAKVLEGMEKTALARQANENQIRLTRLQDQTQQNLNWELQQGQNFDSTKVTQYTGLDLSNNPYSLGVQKTGNKMPKPLSFDLGFVGSDLAEMNKPERAAYPSDEAYQNAMKVWRAQYGK